MRSMLKDRRAVGPVGAIFLFLMFLVVYFVFLASFISEAGTNYVQVTGATGFEAFFYLNLNLWIILCMILGMLAWTYFGGTG